MTSFRDTLLESTGYLTTHRLNYILWIQDLLDTTSDEYLDQYDPDRDVIGMDMYVHTASQGAYVSLTNRSGTGASCIYPLLGCRQRPRWMFGATGSKHHIYTTNTANMVSEIDERSLQYARENVARNNLKTSVRLVKTKPNDPLIPLGALGLDRCVLPLRHLPFLY